MTDSGVPWRYRFTYLAGGVNTQGNWLTWQDPAKPPGQFALDYMTSSVLPPAAYIPIFTWYQLLQSTPSTGGNELERDYNNLNNASTMSTYYASFKILMQKAGQYGGQVVVHVEPDLWGYMQQKAAGAGATAVSAKVRSSGFAEAAAFSDNLAGFSSALEYLRDTYAPNALLATHASMWSSSIDIASDTRTSIDARAEADKTAAFLNSAGAGSWDAVFNDVDDHNAAWWELASCGTPPCVNQWFTHWWDPNNINFPNFSRYLAWVDQLHQRTVKPQVVWQVPMGNQYFLTMNNTCGHYQDNVAPYFIAHAGDLFSAGLVAVLFGPGNSCQTSNEDGLHDGVTNNGGGPITDRLGGCVACNSQPSNFADDDGGYLRIFVSRYYAGQSPCGSATATAAPSPPQAAGTAVDLTATSAGCANPQYEFWMLSPGASSWRLMRAYSTSPTWTWNTAGLAAGTYRFSVWARDSSSSGLYTNSLGSYDAFYTGLAYSLVPSCTSVALSTSPAPPVMVGTQIALNASAAGCLHPSAAYEFWILYPGSGTWRLAQPYSSSPSYSWTTAGLAPGTYRFSVWVRDSSSSAAYDAWNANQYFTLTPGCSAVATSARGSGSPLTIAGAASGCLNPSPLYEFWILYPGSGAWRLAQGYSTSATYSWATTGLPRGTYRFSVWVMDSSSSAAYDAWNATLYYALS
ncbi:MAG TPA: hypothetical protein VGA47_12045 [Candidatus Dormibacteraeota bacterium]